jgi:hypothetical protein
VKATPARWAVAAAIASVPWLASAQPLSRQEIENARRYERRADPVFSVLPPASLQKSVRVEAARSYAVFGYNTPVVRVRLPALDSSAYAVVRFVDAKPVSGEGKALPHELEQGLYDPETHATEVRFVSADRKELVPLARAVGRVVIRYPIQIRTTAVRAGSPDAQRLGISIDGPYVKYPEKSLSLPDASAVSASEPIRGYDAAGKRLERYESVQKWELADGVSRKTIAFWGPVATVRFDTVEKWSEMEIPFDLPAAPMRPAGREGLGP